MRLMLPLKHVAAQPYPMWLIPFSEPFWINRCSEGGHIQNSARLILLFENLHRRPTHMTIESTSATGADQRLSFMLLTGLMVGTLDGTAAILDFILSYRGSPLVEFQYIAGGILGVNTFTGGLPTALLGIALHYFIAISWTVLFFLSYPRMKVLRAHWFLVGALYAVFIWVVMNLVVRPLSLVPHIPWTTFKVFKSAAILVLVVGLPIVFTVKKYYASRESLLNPRAAHPGNEDGSYEREKPPVP